MIESPDSRKLAFSVKDVAEKLGVSERHVHRLVQRGDLMSFKAGQRRLITATALSKMMRGA